jgi:hypothetical protein
LFIYCALLFGSFAATDEPNFLLALGVRNNQDPSLGRHPDIDESELFKRMYRVVNRNCQTVGENRLRLLKADLMPLRLAAALSSFQSKSKSTSDGIYQSLSHQDSVWKTLVHTLFC